jgi:hypothetical protein
MLPKNKLTPLLSAWIEILKAKTNATMVTKPNERQWKDWKFTQLASSLANSCQTWHTIGRSIFLGEMKRFFTSMCPYSIKSSRGEEGGD